MRTACPAILLVLPLLASTVTWSAAAETKAFVITTDYSTGSLSVIDLATHAVAKDVASVHSDARIRWYNGLLYVVNRLPQDNIQVIDPAQGYITLRQFSVGNGSNPSDIAFASPTKAYVSRYGSAGLLVVNPATGAPLDTISLADFADSDGIPEMDHMMRVDRYLFVALQRLTNLVPASNPSSVVVIDTEADTVVDADPLLPGKQAIALAARNPVTPFAYDRASGRLLLGCAGAYGQYDGGIEVINPVTLRSEGLAVTESALGGDILAFAWNGAQHSYVIVSDASFNTCLVSWSAVTGTKLATLLCPGGFSLADCALDDRGELYVADNNFTAPGVFVYGTANDAALAGPLDTGLPPNAITFDQATDAATGVAPGGPDGVSFSGPRPNPARGPVRFTLRLARPAEVRVEAFDLSGRRVRILAEGERPAGSEELAWDLRDDAGRALPAGVYLVRARVGTTELLRRAVVVR